MHTAKSEQLIAVGRLGVAAFILLIFYVELAAASYNTALVHSLVTGYIVFALLMLSLTWLNCIRLYWLKLVSYSFDLLAISSLIFVTENSVALLIVFFIFALFCVTLSWQRAGITWIALAVLLIFLGLYLAVELYLKDATFDISQIIIHIACLAVITVLLSFLGSFKRHLQKDLQRLSAWSDSSLDMQHLETFLPIILQHAAEVLRTPRILIAWNEAGSPYRHFAELDGSHFQLQEFSSSLFRPLVEQTPGLEGFLCLNASASRPKTILSTPLGLRYSHGLPLHDGLTTHFGIKQILATILSGGKFFNGWLLFLDRKDMTVDDLYLANVIAKRVSADIERFYMQQQLNNKLIAEERLRMSRDMHDNLLQFLPGIAMHLQAISELPSTSCGEVKAQLQEIQDLISDKQRELRNTFKQLKIGIHASKNTDLACHTCLECLSQTLSQQWGIKVSFTGEPLLVRMPSDRAQEILYLIHEAMINSARHSKGKEVHAAIDRQGNDLQISVRDNGLGFPFKGRFSLDELNAKGIGPKILKERITALGGWLVLDSSAKGSHLWILLPVPQY